MGALACLYKLSVCFFLSTMCGLPLLILCVIVQLQTSIFFCFTV